MFPGILRRLRPPTAMFVLPQPHANGREAALRIKPKRMGSESLGTLCARYHRRPPQFEEETGDSVREDERNGQEARFRATGEHALR